MASLAPARQIRHGPRMEPSLTDTLCTRCGLCCDGTLFADVELAGRAEATRLEILGLEVEEHDGDSELLQLPCAALEGTRCGIYAHRPRCCRTFECRLLQETRRGLVGVERAIESIEEIRLRIGRVRELLVQLGDREQHLPLRERCAEVLAANPRGSAITRQARAELEAEMTAVEATIRTTFLGRN